MRYTTLKYALSVAIAVAALCSCSESTDEPFIGGTTAEPESGEVVIAVSELSASRVATRVTIDTDATPETGDLSAKWSEDDSFSLWAMGEEGAPSEDKHKNLQFTYFAEEKYPVGDKAQPLFLCSNFPRMLYNPEDKEPKDEDQEVSPAYKYTYRAYYPYTEDVDKVANTITYTIPSVQSGSYDSSLDIMHAEAERKDKLYLNTYNTDMGLVFKHDTHMLRIVLPENPFKENRKTVGKIRIVFPEPVVGTLTFDAATDDAPEFNGTSNEIVVDFDEPGLNFSEEGEGPSDPFWVFIAPVNLSGGDKEVKFIAEDTAGEEVTFFSRTTDFPNCAAGRITPVDLNLRWRKSVEYKVKVTDYLKLGEPITCITQMTLPEGVVVANLEQSNIARNIDKHTIEDGDYVFKVKIFEEGLDKLNNATIDFVLESDHAENLTASSITSTTQECTVEAPYLFFEDFSGATQQDNTSNNNSTSMSNANLQDWFGSRWKTNANTSLEFETYLGSTEINSIYYGRVDSPVLKNIRADISVSVVVKYDMGGARTSAGLVGTGSPNPYAVFGTSATNASGGSGNSPNYPDNEFSRDNLGTNGSATSLPVKKDVKVTGVTNTTRLTWLGYYDGRASTRNVHFYLDNIRVSIAAE